MQIVFDEHVSPKIVRALSETCRISSAYKLVSIYSTGLTSAEDETWLERYADDGGVYFVSADRKMLNRPTFLKIISDRSLIGFYLRKDFANQTRIRQLAYAAYWWEPIQKKVLEDQRGRAWVTPNELSGTTMKEVNIASALNGLGFGR